MGLWIIYRDYTSDDRHLNLTEQAINNVLFVEYETD